MKKYIAYLRVSTKVQGATGLGIEAQKSAVKMFLSGQGINEEPESYIEVESGKNADRKELKQAISRCKETGSTLLIAKLDRLSRDIVFIFTLRNELKQAGVDFMALDLPEANTLTLGIMASFAQHERERISGRTKEGLNSVKETIKKQGYAISKKSGRVFTELGNPNLCDVALSGNIASANSRRAKKVTDKNFIQTSELASLLRDGGLSDMEIAERLNLSGYKTARGCNFIGSSISRLISDRKKLLA